MNRDSIDQITKEVTDILLRKNQDYGGASFDLGLNGNMVHLWDKIKRYRNIIENGGENINFEGLTDTLKDIIGYAVIGLHILNNPEIKDKIYGKNT
ncbi:MAG: DUF1599 domain-containing protein [Rikenellaceae bacterium]|jgi:hypothetical protein|nr:DUF1599 domain-containing protein [Rikenellaceae bacterium]